MSVRIVAAGGGRRMPWKNGRGTTLELATDAPESDAAVWTWRLSIADVPERGPFSRFPGVDRRIACLAGDGLRLHRGGRIEVVPVSGTALAFAGEDDVEGEPIGPGVRDVNLMLRRGVRTGELRIERGTSGWAAGAVLALHAFAAPLSLEGDAGSLRLEPGATLVASGRWRWSCGAGAAVVVAEIGPPAAP